MPGAILALIVGITVRSGGKWDAAAAVTIWREGSGRRAVAARRSFVIIKGMRKIVSGILVFLACFAAAPRAQAAVADADRPTPADERLTVSVNALGLKLYGRLMAQPGNIVVSPWNVVSALVMARAGAAGRTERQMTGALGLTGDPEDVEAALAAQAKRLLSYRERSAFVESANAVWVDQAEEIQPLFSGRIMAGCGAEVLKADFARSNETARLNINRWVSRRTRDRFRDLIRPGLLDEMTRLVLVNTLYFKGAWEFRFPEGLTRDLDFHTGAGRSVRVPTMTQVREFPFLDAADLQALELPCRGGTMAMLILLPKQTAGLGGVERTLSTVRLQAVVKGLRPERIRVFLPRFRVGSFYELSKPLSAMGMPDAFDVNRADFSGINGKGDLYLSAVVHSAFVEANEDGAEAAAAAAAVVRAKGIPMGAPPDFRADRPFLFLIRDLKTGMILFIGRVSDPR